MNQVKLLEFYKSGEGSGVFSEAMATRELGACKWNLNCFFSGNELYHRSPGRCFSGDEEALPAVDPFLSCKEDTWMDRCCIFVHPYHEVGFNWVQ